MQNKDIQKEQQKPSKEASSHILFNIQSNGLDRRLVLGNCGKSFAALQREKEEMGFHFFESLFFFFFPFL
jgi:hypothetical protein